ncbi:uncharacterized protein LOC124372358 isoform X3 [Homalodisca vitripennis]|uniref:uncharacterized protein LOC124372358 isoform X3 n=1 Tax=Homalodisca vitripennis TaxID=197043 RepID=UPI001EEAFE3E|nr:uncharacterized protein LOC124372358 isoform X3 [Homalodisca vitripennis]
MWYPVALLGAAFLLQVVAEDSPHRTKRLTTFGKTPTAETDPKIFSESPDDGSKNLYVPYTHGIPRGKECRGDEDCAALEFTTCKVDTDHKSRCLCHDLKPPINGECATKKRDARGYVLIGNRRPPKDGERLFWPVRHKEVNVTTPQPPLFQPYAGNNIELHQNCNYDHECIQGAECVVNNTVKANEKRCYCRFGYEEEDNACNSGYTATVVFSLFLLTSPALLVTENRNIL